MGIGRPSGTVTFLFTDIEGSTMAWDLHGVAMERAQSRHDEILRVAVADHDGYVFSSAGDGIGASFHTAAAALGTAIAVQRQLSEEPWPDGLRLRVRMGMHTGVAVERDGDYFGPDVIRAARLMGLVDGARLVCSARTASLVADELPDGYGLIGLGVSRLKGLAAPEDVMAVQGPGLDEPGVLEQRAVRFGHGAPQALSRLIGRRNDVDDIVTRLMSSRLVTVSGTGGVGKTRLAIEVAGVVGDKFPDGVVWVELAAVTSGGDVIQVLADALAVQAQPGVALTESLVHALAVRHVLIAFDNAEHVRDATARLVELVVSRCSDVAVVVTSRERLGLIGESIYPLAPLATGSGDAPASELLLERIGDLVTPTDDDIATVAGIAERLDGLPLALELVAARCRTLGVAEVAERLSGELRIVSDASRRDDRHQTLERALNWSYGMLTPEERTVLQRVSVFAGGFTLAGAHRVAGLSTEHVDDAVASLVDKSLVYRRRGRFHLLQTTRQFAHGRLEESGRGDGARSAHVLLMQERVRDAIDGLSGRGEVRWLDVLDEDWPDVRLAVRHAFDTDEADAVIDMISHLAHEAFWRRPEAFAWTTEAYSRYGDRPGPHQNDLAAVACFVAWVLLDVPNGVALAERALALNPAPCTGLWCLPEMAAVGAYNFAGQPNRAVELCQQVIPVQEAKDADWHVVHALGSLALSSALTGDNPAAIEAGERAVLVAQRLGNPTMTGYALFALGVSRLMNGQDLEAAELFTTARSYATTVRNTWVSMTCASVAARDTRLAPTDQLGLLYDVIDEQQRTGWTTYAWTSMWFVPALLLQAGHDETAAFVAGACITSGTRPMYTDLPTELAELDTNEAHPLHQRFRQARNATLPEALREARSAMTESLA